MIKKISLIILLFIFSISLAFAEAIDIIKLQEDIDNCPYSWFEYKKDKFDCSNMTAMLGDWLDIKGYRVKFYRGFETKDSMIGHSWVVVKGDTELEDIYIETTFKQISDKEDFVKYKILECVDDYELLSADKDEWLYSIRRIIKALRRNND